MYVAYTLRMSPAGHVLYRLGPSIKLEPDSRFAKAFDRLAKMNRIDSHLNERYRSIASSAL